jgi:hypothetical protein
MASQATSRKLLGKRSKSRYTPEKQGFSIWDILFPDTPRPDSVYLDRAFFDVIFLVRQYMATEGVTRIQTMLHEHNGVLWTLPGNENDFVGFQNRVVRKVLESLFENMEEFVNEAETRKSQAKPPPLAMSNGEPHGTRSSVIAGAASTNSLGGQGQTDRTSYSNTPDLTGLSEI